MSLVHEALQKAEREKQRKLGTAPSTPILHSAPHAVSTPVVHTPIATAPVAHVAHEPAVHKTVTPVEETTEANNFLLPALIFCVAIVAIIAIVFLVSNATSVLRPSRENAPVAVTAASAPVNAIGFARRAATDRAATNRIRRSSQRAATGGAGDG